MTVENYSDGIRKKTCKFKTLDEVCREKTYYVIYSGIGGAILTDQESKELIEYACGKSDELFLFDEESKKMLMEKGIFFTNTLYKTDPVIYYDLKEEQRLVDEYNTVLFQKMAVLGNKKVGIQKWGTTQLLVNKYWKIKKEK